MNKKNYEQAALIVKNHTSPVRGMTRTERVAISEAFIKLFQSDNPRFNEAIFLEVCFPGEQWVPVK